jgi:cell division protein FtsB
MTTTEMMASTEERPVPLHELLGQISQPTQRILVDLARSLLDQQLGHASMVMDPQTKVATQIGQMDMQRAQIEGLEADVAELRDERDVIRYEAEGLRQQNVTLLEEREAHEGVVAAVARYAEAKRRVDAVLAATGQATEDDPAVNAEDAETSLCGEDAKGACNATVAAEPNPAADMVDDTLPVDIRHSVAAPAAAAVCPEEDSPASAASGETIGLSGAGGVDAAARRRTNFQG